MSKKILIVEDESIIAAEIEALLTKMNYKVVGKVRNGDKALDFFSTKKFDLALLDISIKGTLDGVELAKIIKTKYKFPFVFLTSYSDLGTLERVKETLPYGFIVKPFTENDLRSSIELALFKFESEFQGIFPKKEKLEEKLKIGFSQREYDLYASLFEGKTYKEMGEANFVSVNTVKYYLKILFQKLNVTSRHEAVSLILKLN